MRSSSLFFFILFYKILVLPPMTNYKLFSLCEAPFQSLEVHKLNFDYIVFVEVDSAV